MKKRVITVEHVLPSGCRPSSQLAEDFDQLALNDAKLCAKAVQQKFGGFRLTLHKRRPASYDIVVDVSEGSPVERFELFAEGFMASSMWWER